MEIHRLKKTVEKLQLELQGKSFISINNYKIH